MFGSYTAVSEEALENASYSEDGQEKVEELSEERHRRKPRARAQTVIQWSLCLSLLVVVVVLISTLRRHTVTWSSIEKAAQPPVDKKLPPEDFWSDIPWETRQYQGDPLLKRLDEVGDEAWLQRVQPDGDGFVVIKDPRRYDIPPSAPTVREQDPPGSEIYSVAVTHSLHCLWSLRHVFVMRERGLHTTHDNDPHINHCFDYLRFALQCAGDTALEWGHKVCVDQEDGTERCHYHFDPTGSRHQCRDWEAIAKRMESVRVIDTVSARNYTNDFRVAHHD